MSSTGLTTDEALALAESEFWEELSFRERAEFQLFERKLCMPFGVFHEAVEKTLGRSVFTHEFGSSNVDRLRREFLGEAPAPTPQDIIRLIPEEKRFLVVAGK